MEYTSSILQHKLRAGNFNDVSFNRKNLSRPIIIFRAGRHNFVTKYMKAYYIQKITCSFTGGIFYTACYTVAGFEIAIVIYLNCMPAKRKYKSIFLMICGKDLI
jgi:hypothetical protein